VIAVSTSFGPAPEYPVAIKMTGMSMFGNMLTLILPNEITPIVIISAMMLVMNAGRSIEKLGKFILNNYLSDAYSANVL
jgi:hypothetical protein